MVSQARVRPVENLSITGIFISTRCVVRTCRRSLAAGQLHEKLFTHNGLRMGVVNCCEEALTLGFAKSREWCGRRIRAVEFARRVWGPEGSACTHSGA